MTEDPSECQSDKQTCEARDAGFCGAVRKECRECVVLSRGAHERFFISQSLVPESLPLVPEMMLAGSLRLPRSGPITVTDCCGF